MNIRVIYPLVLAIFCLLASHTPLCGTHLISGTLAFPATLHHDPLLRIYYGGHIIPHEIHANKKVSFWVPADEGQTTFYLLVTESVRIQQKKAAGDMPQNTIEYLKVPRDQPYKLYALELVEELPDIPDEKQSPKKHKLAAAPSYHWVITEQSIDTDSHRIPDETIVVCYFPEYIDAISGGSSLELPTVTVKSDIVKQAGSEDKLHEASTALVLASIESDTFHAAAPTPSIKQGGERVLIASTLS